MRWLLRAWTRHNPFRPRIQYAHWHSIITSIPVLSRLDEEEKRRLYKLTTGFLKSKKINGTDGFEVDDVVNVTIAAQACLLILNLGLGRYAGWHEIIVYPDTFVATREESATDGLVHQSQHQLLGESWHRGPVILSWAATDPKFRMNKFAHNVILHEFAHKLDMLNGPANGMPPLHPDMPLTEWTSSLSTAFADLNAQIDRHQPTTVDPYAAENPAEFFAVFTELFFEQPTKLHQWFPDVYHQLRLYYRQNPEDRA